MIRFAIKQFEERKDAPADYMETVLSLATREGDDLIFNHEDYLTLLAKYSPEKLEEAKRMLQSDPLPVPRSRWPLWVKTMALLSTRDDKGIGDTFARIVGPIGGNAFKEWHLNATGKPCGCSEDQEAWNIKYPLT